MMNKPAKKKRAGLSGKEGRKSTREYTAPALEKGLDILELFAQQTEGFKKSDVARRLNRTVSEVFRMLVCLQSRGYIRQDKDERYTLTLRMFQLAQQHPPTKRLTYEAMTVMHDVAERIQQSCHLAVIENGVVVILASAASPASGGYSVKPGSQIELMSATSGYVILAHQQLAAQARIVEHARQRGSRVPGDLTAHLERIRQKGFEQEQSYEVEGVINISFPILDSNGEAIAALSVPFLPKRSDGIGTTDVVAVLRRSSEMLSKAMGHTDDVHPSSSNETKRVEKTRVRG